MAGPGEPGGMGKAQLRILKFLAAGTVKAKPAAGEGAMLLERDDGVCIAADRGALHILANAGLLVRAGTALRLSAAGAAALKRANAGDDPYREQHAEIAPRRFDTPDGWIVADVNMSESPLAQLARRRARDGAPFLAEAEWRSGKNVPGSPDALLTIAPRFTPGRSATCFAQRTTCSYSLVERNTPAFG